MSVDNCGESPELSTNAQMLAVTQMQAVKMKLRLLQIVKRPLPCPLVTRSMAERKIRIVRTKDETINMRLSHLHRARIYWKKTTKLMIINL
jgi:hypothetical protein